MNELSNPRKRLTEYAQKRIDSAIIEGTQKRRTAELDLVYGDPESELAFRAVSFESALGVMAVTRYEFRRAGFNGERLKAAMKEEIEAVSNSWQLGEAGESQLNEMLLEIDWGW